MNFEHHSRAEPFPGKFLFCFSLIKIVCLFVFQKCMGRSAQRTGRTIKKKEKKVNASNDEF